MNIQDRLRHCAKHTGLDAVVELLTEAASYIDAMPNRPQVQGEAATVAVDHFDNQVEVMKLKDEGIKNALVKLGWTPPGMAPSIHEDNVRTLQGIIDDLRIILGAADGESITDAARRAATKQPSQATQAEVTDALRTLAQSYVDEDEASTSSINRLMTLGGQLARAILALRPSTAPNLACKSVQARLADQWGYVRPAAVPMTCHCQTCRPITITDMRMVLCPKCGNKRCPHANDHRNSCTGSNEPGQPGSAYPDRHGITAQAKKETP